MLIYNLALPKCYINPLITDYFGRWKYVDKNTALPKGYIDSRVITY